MSHPNSPLTFEGKRRLCERVDAGRPLAHVAVEAGFWTRVVPFFASYGITRIERCLTDNGSCYRSRKAAVVDLGVLAERFEILVVCHRHPTSSAVDCLDCEPLDEANPGFRPNLEG